MFCKRLNPIFAFVGVATFAIGLLAMFVWNNRHYQHPKPELRFEELEIKGFDQVTSANDGDVVTVTGGVDIKWLCISHSLEKSDLCELWLLSKKVDGEGMPVRAQICSDTIRNNCISPFEDPMKAFALDSKGSVVDFFGYKQIEPNFWTTEGGCDLRITGHVTRVNGIGRFIDPIIRIDAGPKYK